MKILIVEDDPMMLEIFAESLVEYDVTSADSAEEALKLAESDKHFDLRFVDGSIPWTPGSMSLPSYGEEVMRAFMDKPGETICISNDIEWAMQSVKIGICDRRCPKMINALWHEINRHIATTGEPS